MGANPIMKQSAWKKSVKLMMALSVLAILAGIIMYINENSNAGLLLILGAILFLFSLGMRWGITGMFPSKK